MYIKVDNVSSARPPRLFIRVTVGGDYGGRDAGKGWSRGRAGQSLGTTPIPSRACRRTQDRGGRLEELARSSIYWIGSYESWRCRTSRSRCARSRCSARRRWQPGVARLLGRLDRAGAHGDGVERATRAGDEEVLPPQLNAIIYFQELFVFQLKFTQWKGTTSARRTRQAASGSRRARSRRSARRGEGAAREEARGAQRAAGREAAQGGEEARGEEEGARGRGGRRRRGRDGRGRRRGAAAPAAAGCSSSRSTPTSRRKRS